MTETTVHPGPTPEPVPDATSDRSPRPRRRWAVPVAVAGVVAAAVATPPLVAAAGDADVPDVTAEQLLADVLAAEPTALEGTVVHTARLGLPELPISEMSGADPLALLGGSSTVRVWTDGVERARTALLGSTSEYSVVRDGSEAWTYSSSDDEVVHYTLDAADRARYEAKAEGLRDGAPVAGDLPTPEEGARLVLEKAGETSLVTLDAPTTVAGRDAYQLVVTPRDDGTLVSRVVVAVDAETSVPLRVQAWGVADADVPALEVGFTDVAFTEPADSVLTFTAPAGASVRDVVVPLPDEELAPKAPADAEEARAAAEAAEDALASGEHGVTVTGEGWSRVVEVQGADVAGLLAADPAALAGVPDGERLMGSESGQELLEEFKGDDDGDGERGFDLDTAALYEQLTTEVPEGRLLSSALLSILVTDDGRVLAGAVPPQTLRDLA